MSPGLEARGSLGGEDGPSLTAEAVARLAGGELRGEGSVVVRRVAPLDRATDDALTFLASPGYAPLLATSTAAVVLVSPALAEAPGAPRCRIVVEQPMEALLRVLPSLYPEPARSVGIHATAIIGRGALLGEEISVGAHTVIGPGATLGKRVRIGPNCEIGPGVRVGDDCELLGSVTLYSGTVIGRRVRIQSGARIGADGFGYTPTPEGARRIPHVGRCLLEDDVEIGANTTIDRGSIDDTVIGAGTKIDNLVQIAHNVRIGRLCFLAAQVGIAGSVRIGDGCVLAGQVGIAGHHVIGDHVTLGAQAGVFGNIPSGETWSGYPARPHKESLRASAALFKISGYMRELERLLRRGDA
ncbi:MAG TPA: UDP-3-O-(3-hydroxymyristoyl)glucosamine N-acyltransferase [Gemmatimonadaceae bacterium]|nr:UDP-3-O-(3-hydroxymyristoyl)glucosamine N-acyltransferase [Gemmatimonadaceae bacterium]